MHRKSSIKLPWVLRQLLVFSNGSLFFIDDHRLELFSLNQLQNTELEKTYRRQVIETHELALDLLEKNLNRLDDYL